MTALTKFGISAYFYLRTMTRNNTKTDRTINIKMAGIDWNQHMDFIQKRKEYMLAQPYEDWWCISEDNLKLHATCFLQGNEKIVICFHGYTSEGTKDYIGLSGYYLKKRYSTLLVDEIAHGKIVLF